jgi:hypothetical protein
MRIRLLAALLVLCLPAFFGSAAVQAHSDSGCSALHPPASLGKTLLALHRDYMRHRPDVHDPKIGGPVGPVHLGECAGERYAVASFDARYNGYYFGVTDQPERFEKPPGDRWRDIGNTGGEPCGSMPTALLVAWKLVRACPG